jgi:hypothetical protein
VAELGPVRALLVGVAGYPKVPPLPPSVLADAQDFRDALVALGYADMAVEVLLDGEATRAGWAAALAELATVPPEATVLVYFSGHGALIGGAQHLLPFDADPADDLTLAATSLAGTAFQAAVDAIPARRVVVVLDCCHAAAEGKALTPVVTTGVAPGFVDGLATGGRVVFAACRPDERSWVAPGARNSAFTTRLLEGLRSGVAATDGFVRVFDLFEYVQPLVTRDQPAQHPVFRGTVEESFPIAVRSASPAVTAEVDGFDHDAYVSFADVEPDATYVWDSLMPTLQSAGLRVVVSTDVEMPGVARVVSAERGIQRSKRTVLALSPAYLDDRWASFQNTLAQHLGVEEGTWRLLPVKVAPIEDDELPPRIAMLAPLDLTDPRRGSRNLERLIAALRGPLPEVDQ